MPWQLRAMRNPFRYFNSSPEVIRLVVMMYVRYPLSLRNVEDLLAERGIDNSHETIRFWWNWFGPVFAAEIRKKRAAHMRGYPQWRWHLGEVFVKINGELCGVSWITKARFWKPWSLCQPCDHPGKRHDVDAIQRRANCARAQSGAWAPAVFSQP